VEVDPPVRPVRRHERRDRRPARRLQAGRPPAGVLPPVLQQRQVRRRPRDRHRRQLPDRRRGRHQPARAVRVAG
jgi:hypothetical protein